MRARQLWAVVLLAAVSACSASPGHTPLFVERGYEPFNRTDTVAIALREWRLFGSPVEGDPHEGKPERLPGLWERVGEYWWLGQRPASPEAGWTGKHDARGKVFPAADDGDFAWSAAFISYVMRMAGAGERFPYAPDHAAYVNAAAAGRSPILRALAPESAAPRLGDLICFGRAWARSLTFAELPTGSSWPGHCAIVVALAPAQIDVIGGNVDDAVAMTHVPVSMAGLLTGPDGQVLDPVHPWFVVLQVKYDAEAEPAADR